MMPLPAYIHNRVCISLVVAIMASPLPSQFTPEPDLYPLYPSTQHLNPLLSLHSGLSPAQKHTLVQHLLARACVFANLAVFAFLLADPNTCTYLDPAVQDEDSLGLLSTTILGFGGDSNRDVEREECVRLLVKEGANVNVPDKASQR